MPFEPGRSGNPAGGPVGSRHRQQLNGEFIAALLRDFRQGGAKAIERVRRTRSARLRLSLEPQQLFAKRSARRCWKHHRACHRPAQFAEFAREKDDADGLPRACTP